MHPQVLQQAPEEMVLDLVMRRFNIHKAEVERLVGMHVLVNAMLKGERMGNGAKARPVLCLSFGLQLLQLSVLDQAPYHKAGTQPANGLTN